MGSDVRVDVVGVTFRRVPFAVPLRLSSGSITELTEARVLLRVINRAGRAAAGVGSVLLSYPWAGGTDAGMREAVRRFATSLPARGFADPIQHGLALSAGITELADLGLPRLAAEVALGPVDQAVHDGWSRAIGASGYRLYNERYLAADLAGPLGADFAGRFPGDYLRDEPATELPVQWVVGVDEPLPASAGYPWLKLKLSGDPERDIPRVRAAARCGARVSLDPNEGYRSAGDFAELVAAIEAEYVEQPVPRDAPGPGPSRIPVLADEGLPSVTELDRLIGWDGVVVKTCRGQTAALLTYCWALERGRFVVQQDLTHVGPALAHAAAFAAHCNYTADAFECNSLQYAPAGNAGLARDRPELVSPWRGRVRVRPGTVGIR
jgi:hypothetical protein